MIFVCFNGFLLFYFFFERHLGGHRPLYFFFSYRDSVTILSWLLLLLLDARRRGSKIQMSNTDNLLPH
jgi:hypothetical protein